MLKWLHNFLSSPFLARQEGEGWQGKYSRVESLNVSYFPEIPPCLQSLHNFGTTSKHLLQGCRALNRVTSLVLQ